MFDFPMTSTLRKLLVSGVAALGLVMPSVVLAQAPAAPASIGTYAEAGSGPGLWVIKDEDSTVYLFGTFHALKPDTPWRTRAVDAAFASADEYWFEVADLSDIAAVQPIVMQKGFWPDRPLSSHLSADEIASLDRAARTVGLTAAQLDPMAPWFASLNLAMATVTAAGYRAENGGDQVLQAMASATGRPIKGFESMAQQVGFLAGLDEAGQLQMLRSGLADFDRGPEQLHKMVSAWARGDMEGLDAMVGETARLEAPQMYEIIFTTRNKDWANQVESLLKGSGTAFIAVGAGHLAGPDSLQAQLEQRGIHAARVASE